MIAAAFAIGFFGSLHCVGMCGPLALALPLPPDRKLQGILLYNLGRILTYSFLGTIFGLIGTSFFLAGWQKGLSVVLGAVILVLLVLPHTGSIFIKRYLQSGWAMWVRQKLQQQFRKRTFTSAFASGVLNGFLPCGLVYVAVAGALASATIYHGAFYMAAFGAGTLPTMLLVNLVPGLIFKNRSFNSKWILTSLSVMVSLLLLYRGLLLDLPVADAISRVGHGIMIICR